MSLFDQLVEHGPEMLVGSVIDYGIGVFEVVSVLAIGNAMIVYDLETVTFEPLILKVPRNAPGTPEYERTLRGYRLAIEALERNPDLPLMETIEIEIDGLPCFLQPKATVLSDFLSRKESQ